MNKGLKILGLIVLFSVLGSISIAGMMDAIDRPEMDAEYRDAFGKIPPTNAIDRAQQGNEVRALLQEMYADQAQARAEYESFQKTSTQIHREETLSTLREKFEETQDHFSNACEAAKYYKIPPQFRTLCK
jgi:hypothetical protein